MNQKKIGVAILISDKVEHRTKNITRHKKVFSKQQRDHFFKGTKQS